MSDPLESINRVTYQFNKAADQLFLKPVAKSYHKFAPEILQYTVGNFFANLSNIPTFINTVLQGRFHDAAGTLARFTINTVVGIGGLFDPASHVNLPKHKADFGQTLARFGYKHSMYLVLPLLGPSTVRDVFGRSVDSFAGVAPHINSHAARNQFMAASTINKRTKLLGREEVLDLAVDEYILVRDAYVQYRDYKFAVDEQDVDPLLGEPPE